MISEKKILAALKKANGRPYIAARALGCDPQTIYNWRNRSPAVRAALASERGLLVDEAEESIRDLVKEKNPQATIFVLKTMGRGRGWTEHPEALGELEFDLEEMNQVMRLLKQSGMDIAEFMARARSLAESRLAQLGIPIPPELKGEVEGADDTA